jgi:hypothetical protein
MTLCDTTSWEHRDREGVQVGRPMLISFGLSICLGVAILVHT